MANHHISSIVVPSLGTQRNCPLLNRGYNTKIVLKIYILWSPGEVPEAFGSVAFIYRYIDALMDSTKLVQGQLPHLFSVSARVDFIHRNVCLLSEKISSGPGKT